MTHEYQLPRELVAAALQHDERVAQAKRLLLEAVREHQQQIKEIKPPIPALKQSYQEILNKFAEYRGAKLWFPYLGSGFGNGPLVELADGSIKYDFISGIGTHYWGHNHPDLLESTVDAALSDIIMQGHLQQNVDSLELSSLLTSVSGFKHCFLATSGAMANENALKIAFQKHFPANRIFAFDRCFAGRTLATSQISDKPNFREGLPANLFVDYIPFFDASNALNSINTTIKALKTYLNRYPQQHALMCLELVQGEGGFYTASKEFYLAIMSILKEQGIAIFVDEVQSFGRTSELFAFQYFGLESYVDIVSIGKLSQICATLFNDAYLPRPGLLSQTFTSSTAAIKASLVIIKGLLSNGYFGPQGKIASLYFHFASKLTALSKKYPEHIQGPFGIGSMIAFTPYDGSNEKAKDFALRLFDAGVLSFIAGSNPTRIRFLIPAGVVTTHDIDQVMNIIEKVLLSCS